MYLKGEKRAFVLLQPSAANMESRKLILSKQNGDKFTLIDVDEDAELGRLRKLS